MAGSCKGLLVSLAALLLGVCPARGQTVLTNDFNGGLDWSQFHPSDTTADWSTIESTNDCPPASPYEGTRMARFNSCSASSGDEARITSPGMNLTGAEVAECSFWMYRNDGISGSNDWIKFQISLDDGDSYITLHEFYRYRAGAAGWEQKVVPLGFFTDRSDLRIAMRGRSRHGNNIYVDDLTVSKATLAAGAEGKACNVPADCDSNLCGSDPFNQGRCRDAGTACIGAHREPVAAGATVCAGLDLATCTGTDAWLRTDCYDGCGAYQDVHACEQDGGAYQCMECDETCVDIFGISEGCDPDAWCDFYFFGGDCYRLENDGGDCDSDRECLSDNCVASPAGPKYCAPSGTRCTQNDGSAASTGTINCYAGDRYECQAAGWVVQDCYTNCGFYDDVDGCSGGVCDLCASSCVTDAECKNGIVCTANECVGGLALGSTCTLNSQCDSNNCVDGHCCQDVCTAACHSCGLDDSGICKPIPAGQDPQGECPGQGLCAGSCNGMGACTYPQGAVCDTCTRCSPQGMCIVYLASGTDPDDECPACEVCQGNAPGCTPVQAGQDPLFDCAGTAQATCGLDGECDGQGVCRLWPAGTECGSSACANDVEQLSDACDGTGRCVDSGAYDCAPYRCADAEHCGQDCGAHANCIPAAFCGFGGLCLPDLGEGANCQGVVLTGLIDDAACAVGFCFDDNFDGDGAFCASGASTCVHDGEVFPNGYALCEGTEWYKVCEGGVPGWGPQMSCHAGLCDAGDGAGSGYRASGTCSSGPGGGCSTECISCEPYQADPGGSDCQSGCLTGADCWDSYICADGLCQVPEGIGELCATQSDCSAGVCVDGRCCESACTGPCVACNLPSREGFCTQAEMGTDPDEDCAAELASSCSTTGVCDGSGACQLWQAGQVCGGAGCVGNVYVDEATCDGAGVCMPDSALDCSPGRCGQAGCTDGCTQHTDCAPAGFCGQAGTCLTDLLDGQSCADVVFGELDPAEACVGGFCFSDGWSGQGAFCAGDVDACVAVGEIFPPGYRLCSGDDWLRLCLGGDAGWSPQMDCAAAGVCDAGGGPGSGVVPTEICTSGASGACWADCESCYPYRASAPGQCAGICAEDADCWPAHRCDAGSCLPVDGLGSACEDASTCNGLACVDGVCCNLPCDGACVTCIDPLAHGVCLPDLAGTDPGDDCQIEADCGQTGSCDGQAACALQAAGVECAPASCTAGMLTSAGLCDGRGMCQAGREHECPSGACSEDRCAPTSVDGGSSDADGGVSDGGDGELPLRAEAGSTIVVNPDTPVELDGSGSTGPSGVVLAFLWELSSGPEAVQLTGATTARASFVPGRLGVYAFRLVVADGQQQSAPDFVEVHVVSKPGGCGCGAGAGGGALGFIFLVLCILVRRVNWRCA